MQGTITELREREFPNYRESLFVDESTWVAENLEAHLEKPLRYTYRGGELWSEQDQALGPIFARSVEHYRQLSEQNPSLHFQYLRALAEYHEYEHMKAMAAGDAPDTHVVISPLPRQLSGQTRGVLGYQPQRGLGFIRVIGREVDGSISMLTHSFDRSDDPAVIEAMYARLNQTVDWSYDVLEQPVSLDLASSGARERLKRDLIEAGDAALTVRHGGQWFAGRSDADRREAIQFVMAQRDLLNAHVDALIHVGPTSDQANNLRYDFAAAMRRRFEGVTDFASVGSAAGEMAAAGADAAARGEQANGCGLTVTVNSEQQLQRAGYQSRTEWTFGECRVCLRSGLVGGCTVCADCEAADNRGVDLLEVQARALQARRKAADDSTRRSQENGTQIDHSLETQVRMMYGSGAELVTSIAVCGVNRVARDKRSGKQIARLKLVSKGRLAEVH